MESEYATIDIFAFYILCSTFTGILCGHNQSLRIKGNRGKRKECNYLEYHHLAFLCYYKGKRKRALNSRSSVTKS